MGGCVALPIANANASATARGSEPLAGPPALNCAPRLSSRGDLMRFLRKQFLFVFVIVALLLLGACDGQDNTPTPTAPAIDGAQLFVTKGCAVCHGNQGQGDTGPAIIHHTEAQVLKQVREPSGVMPAFDAASLSDAELAAIASFVAALEGNDGHAEPDHGADHMH